MGTALAKLIGETGVPVMLWVYEPELVDQINGGRENTIFLPGFELPSTIRATASFAEALEPADLVLSVTPSQVLREVWRVLSPEGRVMAVLPHRRSPWALMERTPFGQGRPYSVGQASRLLSDSLFEPESWRGALYWPPGKGRVGVRMIRWSERAGSRFWPALAGVILVEATKVVEARVDATATAPALMKSPALSCQVAGKLLPGTLRISLESLPQCECPQKEH